MSRSTPNIAELSIEQRALLELRLKRKREGRACADRIERSHDASPAPLSFAQQRLWFLHQLEPESSLYNSASAVRFDGELNLRALEQAIGEVVARHEALRTTFQMVGDQPSQIVAPVEPLKIETTDLGAMPETERDEAARRIISEAARRPFNLARGPLVRAGLVRLDTRRHVLFISMHHIVSDAWSTGIFMRETAALYAAFTAGRPSPLEPLGVQYADYARWQRAWLDGARLGAQLEYWRQQLGGAPAALELPTDRPRSGFNSFRGGRQRLVLNEELKTALNALSQREGATLFMTLLTAWQILLARYSGQTDILVGTPIANRNRAETENLIGFFVNTLVLRTDLAGDPAFGELLGRVREVCLGAYAHQDVPFEMLVEELQPERSLIRTPLFQVAFALQNTPMPGIELDRLRLSPMEVNNATAKFDLTLSMVENARELTGIVEYNTDLFEPATIERLIGHFRSLLEEIVKEPGRAISDLQLLTPAERRQLIVEWNDTGRDFPHSLRMHQLFEAQAAQTPDATALLFENTLLTYAELNARANRLAHHLQKLGVRPEARIGVLMERSVEMVVAVLGVVKAGGAYVPLDPEWPAQRLRFILASLEIGCLLTQSGQLRVIHELQWQLKHLSHVVCLDVETEAPPLEPLEAEIVKGIWDHVAERAVDMPTAGGFISSYTGEPFAAREVEEYRERVVALAEPFVGRDKRVLEIGCGAGLIMFELAPRTGRYVGLDPSPVTQERNRRTIAEKELDNVELSTGFAHEIDRWQAGSFDLIIIASTAHFFPGAIYFTRVVERAMWLLAPGGVLLLADVMDARRKDEFRESLLDHQRQYPSARTKTALDGELYFDEDFFSDLQIDLPQIEAIEVLHRERGFANELGFRYDVLLRKSAVTDGENVAENVEGNADGNAAVVTPPAPAPRRKKMLWTSGHLRQLPEHNPSSSATAESLAYIIFTSGSTGVPKGVVVRHRSAVNLIDWVNHTFEVSPADRLLFVTSLTFDLSVYDIFGTLAAGASIHIATRADLRDPQRLVRLLCEQPITFWDSAPAQLQQLAPFFPTVQTKRAAARRLARVFLSGDWIPLRLPDDVRAAFPIARVISLGGATEATVWSNYFPVGEIEKHWASVPYGKPIQNAQYHVLDARLNPCPVGVPGALYIGGVCLADGYTDPELTATKFIPNPFSQTPDARLYRTGDLARYFADGQLEFLGRVDTQVKIRGFRIELGEVEAVLSQHPAVETAIVVAREDVPGDKRLVAYVVAPGDAPAASGEEFRRFMKKQLPDYMLPSAFIHLDTLPLTPNGKVDRRTLPAPDWTASESGDAATPPRDELERQLASVFTELLGVREVSIHHNFFKLGGHSLLATQLVARVRDEIGVELPLRSLFDSPTVAGIAELIRQPRTTVEEFDAPDIASIERGDKSLDELLNELDALSGDEVQAMLADGGRAEA